jgi:GNAT superfamily N-acetyltransferase
MSACADNIARVKAASNLAKETTTMGTNGVSPVAKVRAISEHDDQHAPDAAASSIAVTHWTEKLSDGTEVLVRPITTDDAMLERTFIEGLSAEGREYRFLGQVNVSDDLVRRMTDIDRERDVAFVALLQDGDKTVEIGVCRFCMDADTATCECAVAVSDAWQHRGLGAILMGHLIGVARERGFKRMVSIDMAENVAMRHLAKSLGFERRTADDSHGEVVHTLYL